MLNPYFLNNSKQEQNLIQSLVNEQLQMYGIEIFYIPRRYVKKNTVIREVIQSEFDNAYPIEAYLDSYEGYGGQGTLLSKFGIEEQDDLTLIVSRDRYENYITPLIKNIPNIELSTRPKEGDLIYFPLGDRLFEINYVEHEQPFYQLQKNYVYTLKCQLYRYENEVIDTGVETIDDEIDQLGFIQKLQLIGVASTASASISGISSGVINSINITNMGSGFTTSPIVAISSAPPGGIDAKAVAILSNDFVNCDGTKGGTVTAIRLTNPGVGYTITPSIVIRSQNSVGVGAAATASLADGGLKEPTIISGGGGYIPSSPPIITIERPDRRATATATVGAGGILTSVTVTDGGDGYKLVPPVTFSAPSRPGAIGVATVQSNGTGYQINDVVTLVRNLAGVAGTEAILSVTSVTEAGGVNGFTIGYSGYDYAASDLSNSNDYYEARGGNGNDNFRIQILSITTAGGTTATGIAGISTAGIVTSITLTNPGNGYKSNVSPTITISNDNAFKDPSKIQATAVATVNASGEIESINYTNAGAGYTVAPTITIPAPVSTSTGSFIFNEIVTGSSSGTTARVKEYDAENNTLEVSIVDGQFTIGETIIGSESGAEHTFISKGEFDTVDPFADNDNIEIKADDIIDFSKTNPFGMP